MSRVPATLTVGHQCHGIHTQLGERLNGVPFIARAQHRQSQLQQVLEDFLPADTVMGLEKVALAIEGESQGAATGESRNISPSSCIR